MARLKERIFAHWPNLSIIDSHFEPLLLASLVHNTHFSKVSAIGHVLAATIYSFVGHIDTNI